MMSKSFLAGFLGSFVYKITSSANRDNLTFLFYLKSYLIFFLSISLSRNSKTMLNKSGEGECPYLIPDFRRNSFSFSSYSITLVIGLSCIALIMLQYIPSIPSFIKYFIMKGCWILLKAFSASIEVIMWFLSLLLFMLCCIKFIDFHILNHPWISGVKLTWSWYMILLICCRIWFISILLRIFSFVFIKDTDLEFFFCCILVWF
jgi:hypothetical protein